MMMFEKVQLVRKSAFLLALVPGAALAQLALPPVGGLLPPVGSTLQRVTDLPVLSDARGLLRARTDRLRGLVERFPRELELDPEGNPAVRAELLLIGADAATMARLQSAGFRVIETDTIDDTDVRFSRVRVPDSRSVRQALKQLRKLAPGVEASANTLHFESGGSGGLLKGAALAQGGGGGAVIGMIDGGIAAVPGLGAVQQRGFASGAPIASAHGTSVASLIVGSGRVKGSAPGARLLAADVYGRDPSGGNALAVARALGWLAGQGARVVTVSLVGPPNPIMAATVAAVQRKGVAVVAAVGNDGPAAPPAYPASYPGVLAVTGVDARGRTLFEAGRALHLDFAAPGADMLAARGDGGVRPVRGTSFAAPLVAGRLLQLGSIAALERDARDMGPRGPDKHYGRGLVCGDCRTPPAPGRD